MKTKAGPVTPYVLITELIYRIHDTYMIHVSSYIAYMIHVSVMYAVQEQGRPEHLLLRVTMVTTRQMLLPPRFIGNIWGGVT